MDKSTARGESRWNAYHQRCLSSRNQRLQSLRLHLKATLGKFADTIRESSPQSTGQANSSHSGNEFCFSSYNLRIFSKLIIGIDN